MLDDSKFDILNLLRGPPQFLPERLPMPVDFTQSSVAARLRKLDHILDALNVIHFQREGLGQNSIVGQACRCQSFVDLLDDVRLTRCPSFCESFRL